MVKKELRYVNVYYCDHCGKEAAPAPSHEINGKWYGKCCADVARKELALNTHIGFGYSAQRPLLPYEDIA